VGVQDDRTSSPADAGGIAGGHGGVRVRGGLRTLVAALGATIYDTLFYWMSGGVVRDDAKANPVEFTPAAP